MRVKINFLLPMAKLCKLATSTTTYLLDGFEGNVQLSTGLVLC